MAYIINTGISYFIMLYCTSQIPHFLQIEGLWQPVSSKSIGAIFSNSICSLHVSVSHFGNCNISNPPPAEWLWLAKGCVLSPCLFNLYAEYIMRNAGLEEAPAGIKIAGRNINNLRYADDTTFMAESEEELKSSWKWKRRVKKLA